MHLTKFRKSEKWKNKKLKFVNENCIYYSIYYFSKQLICLLHTYSLSRQLKPHQLRIRRENFISIEIILNVFNALPVSLSTQILILAMGPLLFISVSILWEFSIYICKYIYVNFTVPSGRRGAPFFLREQMYISGSTFIKKIKAFDNLLRPWST